MGTSFTFPGRYASLEKISLKVEEFSRNAGLDEHATYNTQLAVDEACSNIIEHAYGGEDHGEILLIFTILDNGLQIDIFDQGKAFNPNKVKDPKLNLPLEEIPTRGLGIFLMRKLMDEVRFEFSAQGNHLTIVKFI